MKVFDNLGNLDDEESEEAEDANFPEEGDQSSVDNKEDINEKALLRTSERSQAERDVLFIEFLGQITRKSVYSEESYRILKDRRELLDEICALYRKSETQVISLLLEEVSSRALLLSELEDSEIRSLASQIAERERWV